MYDSLIPYLSCQWIFMICWTPSLAGWQSCSATDLLWLAGDSALEGRLSHDRHLCTARCGAPYQAEHQPAHFCDCLKVGFNDVQCMITAMDIGRKHLERLTSTSVLSNYKMNLELLVYEEFLQLKIKSVQRERQMFSVLFCYQRQSTKLENQRRYGFVWGMYHHFRQLLADVCHDGKRHSGGGCRQGGMHWHSSLAVLVGFFLICCGLRDVADLQICARLRQKLMYKKLSQVALTKHTEMIWDYWRPRSNIYRNLSSSCFWGDVFRNLAPREPWQEVSVLTFC